MMWCFRPVMTAASLVWLWLGLGALAAPAGAGTRDVADGWLLGPRAVKSLIEGNPPATSGLWVLAGQSRLYGMNELPLLALEWGFARRDGLGQPQLALAWQQLGTGLYREDSLRLQIQLGRRPAVGVDLWAVRIATGGSEGYARELAVSTAAAATVQYRWQARGEMGGQVHLWLPLPVQGLPLAQELRRPLVRGQVWRGMVAVAVAVAHDQNRKPVVAMEWAVDLGPAAWGLKSEISTGTIGPTLSWCAGAVLVRTSHLVHPQLGVTHRVQFGIGAWGAAPW